MDFIVEKNGTVALAEAKRGKLPSDFAVGQIYLPYRKLLNMRERVNGKFDIRCIFLVQYTRRDKRQGVRVYEYGFPDVNDMASIVVKKSREYALVPT